MAKSRKSTGKPHHRTITVDGADRALTFQLEFVYTQRRGQRRGPYGPYWYLYFSKLPNRKAPFTKVYSRYIGKPDDVDPAHLSDKQLLAIIA